MKTKTLYPLRLLIPTLVFSASIVGWAHFSVTTSDVVTHGKIVYVDLRGGFYGIITNAGDKLLTLNLPVEFQHGQISVVFRYRVDNKPTYQDRGTPIG